MSRIKSIILISALAAGVFAPGAGAETARWVVKPVYKSVTRMSDDLYKVKSNSKSAVMDREGRTVISSADSITPFSEGLALVLNYGTEGRMRLDRILRADKSAVTVGDEVYVDQFPFFSEGLLPVFNKSGKAGYMNENGVIAIPFKYSNPHPFSNGLAAVSKAKNMFQKAASAVTAAVGAEDIMGKDKVFYINALGGEMKLPKEIGDIYFGSTFKDGEALVLNKQRQYCIINPQGRLLRIEPSVTLRFDERHALTDIDESAPKVAARRTDGPDVFSDGRLTGYRRGSRVIVPAQFTAAEPFDRGQAIASRFGGTGVLALVNGNVGVTMKKGSLAPTGSDVESIDLEVVLPKDFAGEEIQVEVADKDNNVVSRMTDADDGSGRHSVALMLPKGKRTVRVRAGNLEVWNSQISGTGGESGDSDEAGVRISFGASKVKANSKDAAAVAVTIVNDTSEPLSGPVRMTGASPSVKSVNIPAGGKKTISAYFSKITKSEVRKVTVTIGGHSATRNITLQPFFNF